VIAAAYGLSGRELDAQAATSDASQKGVLEGFYDIDARAGTNTHAADGSPEGVRELHSMLQMLLADRFKLRVRKETRESDVYALVVGPGGPRLKAPPPDRSCPEIGSGFGGIDPAMCGRLAGGPASGLHGQSVEIADLVTTLTFWVDRQVVDRTGLRGRFDVDLGQWSRQLPSPANLTDEAQPDPSSPPLFTVLQDALGLKLERTRVPREILVVDHIEPLTSN
jgi:uncharacterized protein (TIGR03435 family)